MVYLVGGSEGGLVTALSVEKRPELYAGGLAACGPIGDFAKQINYVGDFRVVFDYFFPGIIPGGPFDVPPEVRAGWNTIYVPKIAEAVVRRPLSTIQLLNVTRAPVEFSLQSLAETIGGVLWYDIFGSADATAKLGGEPYDNSAKVFTGSFDDSKLNAGIQRFSANPAALQSIAVGFSTSGTLVRPLITLHTTADPIVPYSHEQLYSEKVSASGSDAMRTNIPISRYGHCQFKPSEALAGFAILVQKVTGSPLANAEQLLPDETSSAEYRALIEQYGSAH